MTRGDPTGPGVEIGRGVVRGLFKVADLVVATDLLQLVAGSQRQIATTGLCVAFDDLDLVAALLQLMSGRQPADTSTDDQNFFVIGSTIVRAPPPVFRLRFDPTGLGEAMLFHALLRLFTRDGSFGYPRA